MKKNFTKVNFQIKSPTIRVVCDGNQLGIMPTEKARNIAYESGLDLVEIAPQAQPPVCSIMDYGKFKYEQKIKDKEQKKKQREQTNQLKEIRLRPMIAAHDVTTKLEQAKKFIEEGKRVQFNLLFKNNRELFTNRQNATELMKKIVEEIKEVANVEKMPAMEGKNLVCRISPKN